MKYHWKLIALLMILSCLMLSSHVEKSVAAEKKHKLKIAHTLFPRPSAQIDSIELIAKEVSKRTNGRITFKVYGTELGDWSELNEMVNRGDIDIMLSPMSAVYDVRWNAAIAPYIVSTYDEAKQAYGPGGFMNELFKDWAKDVNMVWLGTWIQGFSGVSLNGKPAITVEEAKGIKIRVPPVAAFECTWEKLGFTPSLVPYSEVPTAISTGVVDGQAGGGPFQTYSCCRDLNDFFVFYRDFLEISGYTMNLDSWNSLSKDDQALFQEVVTKEVLKRAEQAEVEDMAYLKKLQQEGLKVVDLANHPEKLAKAGAAARECWSELDSLVGKEWMDKIREGAGVK